MHFRQKKSVREIVAADELSRNTVRKWLQGAGGGAEVPAQRAAGQAQRHSTRRSSWR
jgi:hypothetical protein